MGYCCNCQTQIPLPSEANSPGSTRPPPPPPPPPHSVVTYNVYVGCSCTNVSDIQVIGNIGDHNGSFYVRNTTPPPLPYNHAPPGLPPNVYGRKKAVICGISYKKSPHELKGCINDAKCMRNLLINEFEFPEDSIIMLTEEKTDPCKIPYKNNIERELRWLVRGCQHGDSLLFYFSGHVSRLRKLYPHDEEDRYHETLCPLEFETQGMIVDDWINATIVRPIPDGVKLHAIIDCSHSGTILDLPWLCRMDGGGNYRWDKASGIGKGTSGGEVICISGCVDHQTSTETQSITSTGTMTSCFIQAIESGQAATYGSLLDLMRNNIRSRDAVTYLAGMLQTGGSVGGGRLRQDPQLSACKQFHVYQKPFAL
ncbi:putative Caspase-like domain-containing protein [Rosa chinensis]|uniref:Putative Caspase-like domain-containing protein n=1 Tax=Rosa chinensis TaxID=74649 RepID=A0A2P6SEJ9_ROSCH|nr:putative Caspase-like domain-containing protein [Rosa chinensis]